mmetsp:Transcript_51192/g.115070  ORF Transcript_51192/g.115070 Transcript_51192/m.115070 type:complete len:85 (+) Transcript_51192:149-403(+)
MREAHSRLCAVACGLGPWCCFPFAFGVLCCAFRGGGATNGVTRTRRKLGSDPDSRHRHTTQCYFDPAKVESATAKAAKQETGLQ